MKYTIEHEREEDGRWLAEVPELPGVLAYGATAKEAMTKAKALALRVLAELLHKPCRVFELAALGQQRLIEQHLREIVEALVLRFCLQAQHQRMVRVDFEDKGMAMHSPARNHM